MTDPERHECRVYNISAHGEVSAIADSFGEWLEWNYEFFREVEEGAWDEIELGFPVVLKPDSSDPLPLPYWPKQLSPKNGPAKDEVQTWLTTNGNTIRQLARSIRDHGRTDAFPILADALEQAGCTCEDLLRPVAPATPTSTGPGRWRSCLAMTETTRVGEPPGLSRRYRRG